MIGRNRKPPAIINYYHLLAWLLTINILSLSYLALDTTTTLLNWTTAIPHALIRLQLQLT